MVELSELIEKAELEISSADDLAVLDTVRVSYLGKKGALTLRMKELGNLSAAERPAAGQKINEAKQAVQSAV